MSEDEEVLEDFDDGLDCFAFQLLLDDVSSTHKKNRKASQTSDLFEEHHRDGDRSHREEEPLSRSLKSDLERVGGRPAYKKSEDNINSYFGDPPASLFYLEESYSQQETRSECPEPRKGFNIWGEHSIKCKDGLIAYFAPRAQKKADCPNSDVKPAKAKDDDQADPLALKKKKSLRLSKRDEFYPKDTSYRKLSYQESELNRHEHFGGGLLDLKLKLNMHTLPLMFSANYELNPQRSESINFAKYVQHDVPGLLSLLCARLDEQIQAKERQALPRTNHALRQT